MIEGEPYQPAKLQVVRRSISGKDSTVPFRVTRIRPELVQGKPIQLYVTLEVLENGGWVERHASVNHPATVGSVDLLVSHSGVAPVFRLLDRGGRTIDLVAVPAPSQVERITRTPLAGDVEIEVDPVPVGPRFPERAELDKATVSVGLFGKDAQELFAGVLRPGEMARAGSFVLKLEEVRYWARVRIIGERGGWLLMLGFGLGVAGLLWRLLFVRREVGLVWYRDRVVLFGKSEFFRSSFRDELEALAELLVEGSAKTKGTRG